MNHPISLFATTRILIVGDVMLDDYLWGSVRRICPEAPVPVVETHERSCRPGGAANAACNVAALGARAYLVGVTGTDEAGQRLRTALAEANIDAGGLIACDDRPTTAKLRVFAHAHNQQVLRIDTEQTHPLPHAVAERLAANVERLIPECHALLLCDYAKGVLSADLTARLIEAARRVNVCVVVDPKGREMGRYRGATLVKPNLGELEHFCGRAIGNAEDLERAVDELAAALKEPDAQARDGRSRVREPDAQARDGRSRVREPDAQARDGRSRVREPDAQARDGCTSDPWPCASGSRAIATRPSLAARRASGHDRRHAPLACASGFRATAARPTCCASAARARPPHPTPLARRAPGTAASDPCLRVGLPGTRTSDPCLRVGLPDAGTAILVTQGAEGMTLFEPGEEAYHQPARGPRTVFDVTGAGDTVAAVVTLMLACGESLRRAVEAATVAAGIVVGKLGTAVVHPEELSRELGANSMRRAGAESLEKPPSEDARGIGELRCGQDTQHERFYAVIDFFSITRNKKLHAAKSIMIKVNSEYLFIIVIVSQQ